MHHPTDRIAHTTAFVTPVVEHWLEREIALRRVKRSSSFQQIALFETAVRMDGWMDFDCLTTPPAQK